MSWRPPMSKNILELTLASGLCSSVGGRHVFSVGERSEKRYQKTASNWLHESYPLVMGSLTTTWGSWSISSSGTKTTRIPQPARVVRSRPNSCNDSFWSSM